MKLKPGDVFHSGTYKWMQVSATQAICLYTNDGKDGKLINYSSDNTAHCVVLFNLYDLLDKVGFGKYKF